MGITTIFALHSKPLHRSFFFGVLQILFTFLKRPSIFKVAQDFQFSFVTDNTSNIARYFFRKEKLNFLNMEQEKQYERKWDLHCNDTSIGQIMKPQCLIMLQSDFTFFEKPPVEV